MKECCNLDATDINAALIDVLSVLRRRTITLPTGATDSVTIQ